MTGCVATPIMVGPHLHPVQRLPPPNLPMYSIGADYYILEAKSPITYICPAGTCAPHHTQIPGVPRSCARYDPLGHNLHECTPLSSLDLTWVRTDHLGVSHSPPLQRKPQPKAQPDSSCGTQELRKGFDASRAELSTGRVHRLVQGCVGSWDVATPPVHKTRSRSPTRVSDPAGGFPQTPPHTLRHHRHRQSFA